MLEAGVDAKEKALAEARHKLAAADDTVEKKRDAAAQRIDAERAALVAGGTDPAYNEALATIAAADSKDDLATLYPEARRTPTGADEAIVRRLETIDAGVGKADAEIAGLRRSAQELARRRLEVEQVRDRFRSAGYDHPNTTFGNESDIAADAEAHCSKGRCAAAFCGTCCARATAIATAARPSRFRRAQLPLSVPDPGRRHDRLAGRRLARAGKPRRLAADRRCILTGEGSG